MDDNDIVMETLPKRAMSNENVSWGTKAKARSRRRLAYFRRYQAIRRGLRNVQSSIGYLGERFVEKLLSARRPNTRAFDLLWKNKKVEVKTASPTTMKHKIGEAIYSQQVWKFNVKKQVGRVDYFALIQLEGDKKTIISLYLIPSKKISNGSFIRLGRYGNKFKSYLFDINEFGGEI